MTGLAIVPDTANHERWIGQNASRIALLPSTAACCACRRCLTTAHYSRSAALDALQEIPMKKPKTAVLGAGPMGLMCALELLKAGHDVDIYERDDRIGGMSASFDFDGLAIERFYHFIC